jgi:hypothetical protein
MGVVSTGGTQTFFAGPMGTVEVNSELNADGNSVNDKHHASSRSNSRTSTLPRELLDESSNSRPPHHTTNLHFSKVNTMALFKHFDNEPCLESLKKSLINLFSSEHLLTWNDRLSIRKRDKLPRFVSTRLLSSEFTASCQSDAYADEMASCIVVGSGTRAICTLGHCTRYHAVGGLRARLGYRGSTPSYASCISSSAETCA